MRERSYSTSSTTFFAVFPLLLAYHLLPFFFSPFPPLPSSPSPSQTVSANIFQTCDKRRALIIQAPNEWGRLPVVSVSVSGTTPGLRVRTFATFVASGGGRATSFFPCHWTADSAWAGVPRTAFGRTTPTSRAATTLLPRRARARPPRHLCPVSTGSSNVEFFHLLREKVSAIFWQNRAHARNINAK